VNNFTNRAKKSSLPSKKDFLIPRSTVLKEWEENLEVEAGGFIEYISIKKDEEEMRTTPRGWKKLYFKNEVKLNGRHFDLEVRDILDVARETAPNMSDGAVWITSANDGKHMKTSKHYSNEAFDLRVRNVEGQHPAVVKWCIRMREKLGPDYDVIYGDPQHRSHVHIEYDPK